MIANNYMYVNLKASIILCNLHHTLSKLLEIFRLLGVYIVLTFNVILTFY